MTPQTHNYHDLLTNHSIAHFYNELSSQSSSDLLTSRWLSVGLHSNHGKIDILPSSMPILVIWLHPSQHSFLYWNIVAEMFEIISNISEAVSYVIHFLRWKSIEKSACLNVPYEHKSCHESSPATLLFCVNVHC